MVIAFQPVSVPLIADDDGTVRVGGTRVLLDIVVRAFERGASPEEIVHRYDALRLADVYSVIAYYLDHQPEIDAYLHQREEAGRRLRAEIDARVTHPDLYARVIARRTQSSG